MENENKVAREFWKLLVFDLIQSINESPDEAEPDDETAIHITTKGLENAIYRICEVYSEREVLPSQDKKVDPAYDPKQIDLLGDFLYNNYVLLAGNTAEWAIKILKRQDKQISEFREFKKEAIDLIQVLIDGTDHHIKAYYFYIGKQYPSDQASEDDETLDRARSFLEKCGEK